MKQPRNESGEPVTTANMAAELRRDRTGETRTLAVAPGLTHAEAVDFVTRYLGDGERLAQFVVYS